MVASNAVEEILHRYGWNDKDCDKKRVTKDIGHQANKLREVKAAIEI